MIRVEFMIGADPQRGTDDFGAYDFDDDGLSDAAAISTAAARLEADQGARVSECVSFQIMRVPGMRVPEGDVGD